MITLKRKFLEKIIAQSKKEFPNEACGILAGKGRTVEKIYEMNNADASPSTFLMEPQEQLKVMKEIRNSGVEMIGIYHSHVASQAYPSSHDVQLAFYPEVSYLIISLKDKNNPSVRSFNITESNIREEEVVIV